MGSILKKLNVIAECRNLKIPLWECPSFLFILLGVAAITSLITTYIIAARYAIDEGAVIIMVTAVALLFLIVGNLIITGFNKIAEANRMKSEFISIISHQLRSPLSIFKWTVNLLENDAQKGKDPQENLSMLHTLQDTTEGMIRLVNSLLEVGRIESGTINLKREEVSLVKLTDEILRDFGAYAKASDVTVEFLHNHRIPPVWGDAQRLSMVIQNLTDNAIRYCKEKGRVEINIKENNGKVIFSIKDNGVGIPQAQQKYIFQKFFRAENATRRQAVGNGIGLYTAKGIIDALRGIINFNSGEGEGSTFWFTLPAVNQE